MGDRREEPAEKRPTPPSPACPLWRGLNHVEFVSEALTSSERQAGNHIRERYLTRSPDGGLYAEKKAPKEIPAGGNP